MYDQIMIIGWFNSSMVAFYDGNLVTAVDTR